MNATLKISKIWVHGLLILSVTLLAGCGCSPDEEIRINANLADESKIFSRSHDMIYDNTGNIVKMSDPDNQEIDKLLKHVSANPRDTIALNNLAFEYYKAGRFPEALATYTKLLEIDPAMAAAYNNMGLVFFQMGNLEKAIECFSNCVLHDPDFVQAYSSLGLLHFRNKDIPRAIEALDKAIQINAGLIEERKTRLDAGREAALGDEVLKKLEQEFTTQKSNDALAHNNLGLVYFETRDFDKASHHFSRALEIDPAIDAAIYNVAKIAITRKEWNRAREMVTRYLAIRPDHQEALSMLREINAAANRTLAPGTGPGPETGYLKIPMAMPELPQTPPEPPQPPQKLPQPQPGQ